jgi:hypothetical protein
MRNKVGAINAEAFKKRRILLHQPVDIDGHGAIVQDLMICCPDEVFSRRLFFQGSCV